MNKENKKGLKILLIMFAILGLLGLIYRQRDAAHDAELKAHGKITTGKVEDVVIRVTSGGDFSLFYNFSVDGKKVSGSKPVDCVLPDFSYQKVFERKKFPVVYSAINPKVNRMLIGRKEFDEFGVPFPDSLKGIATKYFGCEE